MKLLIFCTAILGLAFAPAAAEAKGCIKGAIVGGVAGHFARARQSRGCRRMHHRPARSQ